jgi:hypothetical protein
MWSVQQMLCVVPMNFNTSFISSLQEVRTLSEIPDFTRISIRCCNTCKSLIDAEYTKIFTCSNSQKSRGLRSGDHAGQLTGPPHPSHCSPKVWFRCCLIIRRKWVGSPSCLNHMRCFDEEAHVPRILVNHSWRYTELVSLLGKATGPENFITWGTHPDIDSLTSEWIFTSGHMFPGTFSVHLNEYCNTFTPYTEVRVRVVRSSVS